jgi:hypothetical protein
MISSIFNSEVGKLLTRIVLPYLAVMGVFCFFFDGWFVRNIVFVVEEEGPGKLNHLRNTHNANEIPIFGNSRSNNGIDPKFISNDAWNYAINGSGCRLLRFELEAELASPRKTPIIIGLDPDYPFANFFGDVLDYVPLSGDTMVWKFLKAQGRSEPYFKLPTWRFYGGFERYVHNFLKNRFVASAYFASNGASISKLLLDPKKPLPAIDTVDRLVGIPTYSDLKQIEGLIEGHPERCFVFAETPYCRKILYVAESTDRYAFLCNRLRQFPNVIQVSLSENELPAEYFCNFTHLNQQGSRWFSTRIKEIVEGTDGCQRIPK